MEMLVEKYNNLSLRKYLVFTVIVTFGVIVLLSAFIIWGCVSFRNYILPDYDNVFLTVDQTYSDGTNVQSSIKVNVGEEGVELPVLISESESISVPKETKYKIQKIENNVNSLSPKKKMAYHFCGIAMVMLPLFFSIAGILLCGFHFYRRKISIPLNVLSEATRRISEKNLDFSLSYQNKDEMGILCSSFEQMRLELYNNYREMWNMLEERRLLQASISHDLRNPIAIIQGYTEYLQINLEKGKLEEQKILKIVENLNLTAKRLESYTESVRTINQMEDIQVNKKKICICDLMSDIEEDFKIMAKKNNIHLELNTLTENSIYNEKINIDASILYRVLENVFGNALRYAKENVKIEWSLSEQNLIFVITDDGNGFSDELLIGQEKFLITKPLIEGHLGIGLAISRILCKKHGGSLEISNNLKHNAVVKIKFIV